MSQSNISIQGPPLCPRTNPRAKRIRRKQQEQTSDTAVSPSAPTSLVGPSRPLAPVLTLSTMDVRDLRDQEAILPSPPPPTEDQESSVKAKPYSEIRTPPTDSAQSAHIQPPSGSSNPVPVLSYSIEDQLRAIADEHVHALTIVSFNRNINAPLRIPLCPFILAHLEPRHHIAPLVPVYLPHVGGHFFYLLYVLKDTIMFSPEDPNPHTQWVAVFVMVTYRYPPTIIGTVISEAFVEQIQKNVKEQSKRLRDRITGLVQTLATDHARVIE